MLCFAVQVEPVTALPRGEIWNIFHLPAVPLPQAETSTSQEETASTRACSRWLLHRVKTPSAGAIIIQNLRVGCHVIFYWKCYLTFKQLLHFDVQLNVALNKKCLKVKAETSDITVPLRWCIFVFRVFLEASCGVALSRTN